MRNYKPIDRYRNYVLFRIPHSVVVRSKLEPAEVVQEINRSVAGTDVKWSLRNNGKRDKYFEYVLYSTSAESLTMMGMII